MLSDICAPGTDFNGERGSTQLNPPRIDCSELGTVTVPTSVDGEVVAQGGSEAGPRSHSWQVGGSWASYLGSAPQPGLPTTPNRSRQRQRGLPEPRVSTSPLQLCKYLSRNIPEEKSDVMWEVEGLNQNYLSGFFQP